MKTEKQDIKLVFSESARDFVLEAFHKTVDDEGYIVEQDNKQQRILTLDGQEIRKDQFAGVRKGSEIYVKSDIVSLIEMCDDIRSGKTAHAPVVRES
jgi:hypothetical protein